MDTTLTSIILPTYNRGWCIDAAVQSALAQTHGEWELIVVDDGSTDDTLGRLQRYDDPRIRVLRRDNGGVSAARNHGIRESRGDMIALLDSDDEWLPEKLETQLAYMRDNGYEICQTEEIWIRNGKRVNQKAKYAKPEGWFFEASVKMCLISPSCTMFTRSVWDAVGPFDETMPSCEDYDMWLRACLAYPVGLVRKALTVKYGGRPDQLSNSVPCADSHRIRALAKLLDSGKLDAGQRKTALDELETKVRIYAQGAEKRGKNDEARQAWNLFCMVRDGKRIP